MCRRNPCKINYIKMHYESQLHTQCALLYCGLQVHSPLSGSGLSLHYIVLRQQNIDAMGCH